MPLLSYPWLETYQAVLNSQTAGVSDIHAWELMLPSSSRVSPVTYHAVVAVRYPDLCKQINGLWELGSFASGGLPDKPPGFQLVLWDTNARINGLVATDLETLVSEVLTPFPHNAGFADGLFIMTTATDHKNNLNRSVLKRDYVRTLRVETIANSAGGTAQVSIVAQPSIGFLNTKYYSNGSPTEDTEDCLGRITVGLTRSKSLTLLVSPLDMMGLMGMAQVIATIAIRHPGPPERRNDMEVPDFDPDPVQENLVQLSRWSLNSAFFFPPVWPIRTRHGPYNSVSGEKHQEKGLVWSKTAGKSSQHKKQTKKRNQKRPANPPARFAFRQKAKEQSNKERGRAQIKTNKST